MYKNIIVLLIVASSIFIYIFMSIDRSIETLIYFPADQTVQFTEYKTDISFADHKNLLWQIESESDEQVYLRQDISLLYANGQFKGILNLWEQNVSNLTKEKRIPHNGNVVYDSISFHHGEIHRNDDDITSIQKMSNQTLYVVEEDDEQYLSFRHPNNKVEIQIKEKLDHLKQDNLNRYWRQLINHFNINEDKYIAIPLIELIQFENKTLLTLSKEQTNRVLGQLWEGLYKNYVIPVSDKKNHHSPHYMPLILIDKDVTHLYVLFELNGEKNILKQLF